MTSLMTLEGLSRLGLGAWAIGGPYEFGWGPVDDVTSELTIHKAYDAGLSWIDTAPAYGCGHSEVVVGRALQQMVEKPKVFTKCGRVWDSSGKVTSDLRPESIMAQWQESVARLHVDAIDLLQIHRLDTVTGTPLSESWAQLVEMRNDGRVHAIGLCNVGLKEFQECEDIGHVDSLQVPVNLMRPGDAALRVHALGAGTTVLAYSPMESGLLSGKFDAARVENLASDDWRKRSPKFAAGSRDRALPILEALTRLSNESGHTVAALAVGWVLRQAGVSAAIVGARRPEQIADWVDADQLQIADDAWASLDASIGSLDV